MEVLKFAALLIFCVVANGQSVVLKSSDCEGKSAKEAPQCKWFYLAYAPRILRAGVDEKVMVMTKDVDFDVQVKATLRDGRASNKIVASDIAQVKPGILTAIVLKVPIDAPTSGTIKIEGEAKVPGDVSGLGYNATWIFENVTKSITIQKTSRTLFIQTDRPIYKPGEAMQMRIVVVDSNLKAVKGKISRVTVFNPSQTLMRQWKDVKLINGVANLKMKLSIKPVLGTWKIQAQMSGLSKTVQVKVEKYVLPKFQVKIKPPPYIALGQTKASGEVCAKYSYGKDVNGFMTAKICAVLPGYWQRRWNKAETVCQMVLKKVSGCAPFEIDLRFFKIYKYSGYRTIKFTMEASVKERATGISLNATKVTKSVESTDVKLSFSGTPEIFKPGLPFEAVLLVTRPDGSRAENVQVSVTVTAGWSKKLVDKKMRILYGRAKIDIPEIPFDAKELRFTAVYKRAAVRGSLINEWKRRTSAYHNAKAWYSPSHSYLGIDATNKVFKVGQDASIKVRYTSVDQTAETRTVYYTLMCKGYAAHSGSIDTEFMAASSRIRRSADDAEATTAELPTTTPYNSGVHDTYEFLTGKTTAPPPPDAITDEPDSTKEPKKTTEEDDVTTASPDAEEPTGAPPATTAPPTTDPPTTVPPTTAPRRWWWERDTVTRPPLPNSFSTGSFQIKFKVTQDMSPSCRLLVYYIRHRETVADSRVIDIEDSFANKVSMKFNEEEVFPGEKVKLTLKASPGSVFAISAVDKSVHFLANANEISRDQVTSILKNLDVGPGYINDRSRCGDGYYWWDYSSSDYVDSQKAFNDGGILFVSNMHIDTRPCKRNEIYPVYAREREELAFTYAQTTTFQPTTVPFYLATESAGRPRPKPQPQPKKPVRKPPAKQIRSDFPETWLWTEEQFDAKTGEKTIMVKVPDTITTWYASGFAISADDGLGVANPAEIKGFKALFVSVNLPYAVTRGELVTIPVVVFNYLSECVNVKISMKNSKYVRSITRNWMDVCLCGGKTTTVMFKAYANSLGRIQIEARAESQAKNNCPSFVEFDGNTYIDIVRKKLLVEPEGIEKEYTYNSLVCPKGEIVADTVKLAIPDKVVKDSIYSELRVIGDLMGPSLANIDSLLKMPYGCGEQNMLNFAPNIFIMQYLKATNQLKDNIKEKATDYTLQGYQRELSYKHSDGSYSAFGESDNEGSMWLTAFVLKSFAQAREFIEIDKKILTEAKRWILSKQTKDGCFPTVGSLHNKAMKGGVKTPVTLTGYVVVALIEADMKTENPSISNAIKNCIKPQLDQVNDTYSLNILTYTMAKAGRQKELAYLLTKLDSLAIKEDGNRYWGEPKKAEKPKADLFYNPYYQARSTDIEQTSYGLMAAIEGSDKKKVIDNIDIVRWLSQQRNSLGGWSSTQDTVLAMQALAMFSAIVHGGQQDMTVDVGVPDLTHKFIVNSGNSLLLQRIEIPPKFPMQLKTFARGQGCALLSASVKYNVKDVKEDPAFKLDVKLSPLLGKKEKLAFGRCLSQEINICATWLREDSSNMAIIAVKMLSGFEPIIESLDKAVSRDVLLKEYEKKGKEYVFYYSRITKKGVCLRFKMKQLQIVEKIQPASVQVYDYYDTGKSATAVYKVTPAQCVGIPTPNP